MAWTADYSNLEAYRHAVVTEAFATITSPVFSELVIVLTGDEMTRLPQDVMLFKTLRKMNEVRPFKLVFLLEVPEFSQVGAQWKVVEVLNSVTIKSLLDFLDSPPIIRTARSRQQEWDTFSGSG